MRAGKMFLAGGVAIAALAIAAPAAAQYYPGYGYPGYGNGYGNPYGGNAVGQVLIRREKPCTATAGTSARRVPRRTCTA